MHNAFKNYKNIEIENDFVRFTRCLTPMLFASKMFRNTEGPNRCFHERKQT